MTFNKSAYLPDTDLRARWLPQDVAGMLKRFFLCEQALIISQAAWLAAIGPLEVKLTLPRLLWEDTMTANALRERVFELRFPSRLPEVGPDAPLVELFEESLNAPSAEALVLSLGRVFKPALYRAYRRYLEQTDEIADGPTLRFLRLAAQEKYQHINLLTGLAEAMLTGQPERRTGAEAWVNELNHHLAAVGGLSAEPPQAPPDRVTLSGRRPFQLPGRPARDERFHRCRFYWPDIIDPDFSSGEEIQLQLRSAVSQLNEVWAVEIAGAVLAAFAKPLGWEYIFDAARWTYDESRHCRMGAERLHRWGFEPAEIPLGTYIYSTARAQDPILRLGMLTYFETKNIGQKLERAKSFANLQDQTSRHDMEFDWADETMHAHFGQRWLKALHDLQPEIVPSPDVVKRRGEESVTAFIATATETERAGIHRVVQAMIAKVEAMGDSGPL